MAGTEQKKQYLKRYKDKKPKKGDLKYGEWLYMKNTLKQDNLDPDTVRTLMKMSKRKKK